MVDTYGGHRCCCSPYRIISPLVVEKDSNFSRTSAPWLEPAEPLYHDSLFCKTQDFLFQILDFVHVFKTISPAGDKCFLHSRLSKVVHSDYSSECPSLWLSLQVTVPLVINDNFNDVCSLLQEVKSCFSSSIRSSVGISSQLFVSPDTPPFEPNS